MEQNLAVNLAVLLSMGQEVDLRYVCVCVCVSGYSDSRDF